MPTLNINGRRVTVDDSFLSLSPQAQNATVDEITQSPEFKRFELQGPDGKTYEAEAPDMAAAAAAFKAGPWTKYQGAPIEIDAPDGSIVEFPANTSDDVIKSVMRQNYPPDGPWSKYASAATASPQWSDVPAQALSNLGPSAAKLVRETVTPFMQPVETAKSLGRLALGTAQKLYPGVQAHEQYADAVGNALVDRYGSVDAVKRTLATDPVGAAADAASILMGGGGLAARAPGIAGRVGQAAATAGRAIDPFTAAGKGVAGTGRLAAALVGGLGTHTGGTPIKTAFGAGMQGGEAARTLRENMRGSVPMEDVVSQARGAVGNLRQERAAQYGTGMAPVRGATKVLDFADIDKAVQQASDVKKFKGVDISPTTAGVRQRIDEAITAWKNLPAKEYHTAAGFDALKQQVGDIMEGLPYNTPERLVAERAYNAIKDAIKKQVPGYEQAMRGYATASDQIKEIERALSLGKKASTDTALRKLQSVMRNNVNTNYGKRAQLAETLAAHGAPNLMESLAGQSLSAITPRGIGNVIASGAGIGGIAFNPALLATLPLMSPRLVGEGAYHAGRAAKPASKALSREALVAALLAGRSEEAQRKEKPNAR